MEFQTVEDLLDDGFELNVCLSFPFVKLRNKRLFIHENLNLNVPTSKFESQTLKAIMKNAKRIGCYQELLKVVDDYWKNHPHKYPSLQHVLLFSNKFRTKHWLASTGFYRSKNVTFEDINDSSDDSEYEDEYDSEPVDYPTDNERKRLIKVQEIVNKNGVIDEYQKKVEEYLDSLEDERPCILFFERICEELTNHKKCRK